MELWCKKKKREILVKYTVHTVELWCKKKKKEKRNSSWSTLYVCIQITTELWCKKKKMREIQVEVHCTVYIYI